jgi:hypothetical protein
LCTRITAARRRRFGLGRPHVHEKNDTCKEEKPGPHLFGRKTLALCGRPHHLRNQRRRRWHVGSRWRPGNAGRWRQLFYGLQCRNLGIKSLLARRAPAAGGVAEVRVGGGVVAPVVEVEAGSTKVHSVCGDRSWWSVAHESVLKRTWENGFATIHDCRLCSHGLSSYT